MEIQKLRLRYKKCVKCSLVNDEAEEINECKNDISCPAGKVSVIIGEDPEIITSALTNSFLAAATDTKDVAELVVRLTACKPEFVTAALARVVSIDQSQPQDNSNSNDSFNDDDEILS